MSNLKKEFLSNNETPRPKKLIGLRHYQYVLMSLSFVMTFAIRTAPSVAIISMTEEKQPDSSIPTYPDWGDPDTILSSFFFGYILTQLIAGQLSEYFGPKWFLAGTMLTAAIFNIAIPPMAAAFGSGGVMVCRVIQGLCQGFVYPCITNLISKWTPLFERARIANFVYGAANLGIAVSMPITGAICGSNLGWPMSYYILGGAGIIWALLFAIFAQNSPSDCKNIPEDEKFYIENSNSVTQGGKKIPTPWISVFKSVPVWAIFVGGIAQCFGGFTLLTEIPSYLNGVLKYDISSNSQISALPYVAQFFTGLITSPLSDKLLASGKMSITTSRKVFHSLASFPPAAALIYLAFLENFDENLVIVLLIIAVASSAFQQSGYLVNVIDVAPNHSGTLFGLVNGINNIFSMLAPLTVGLLGDDKTDPILWRKVFLLAAGIYIVCGIFYTIFTSAEVQPWNDLNEEEESELKEKTETYKV